MDFTLRADARVSMLVSELARLTRAEPDLATIDRLSESAHSALDELEHAVARHDPFERAARLVYASGLLLALALPRAAAAGHLSAQRLLRFRATAIRLIDLAEPYVPDADRARRETWLACEPLVPARARA